MSEEIKSLLDELQNMVMDYHRYAANLDGCVQDLRDGVLNFTKDKSYNAMYIDSMKRYYDDKQISDELNSLKEKENDIWQRLIEAVKDERV